MLNGFVNNLSISIFLLIFTLGISEPVAAQDIAEAVPAENKNQASSVSFQSVQQLDELVELGLPSLSLQLLKQEQARLPMYSADWYSLEHKRISLLTELGRWQKIIDRVDELVSKAIDGKQINSQIKQWFITQKAIAKLRINQADEALDIVRQLIWSDLDASHANKSSGNRLLPLWRRLVIRAYLLKGLDEDARKSLLRYQIDYKDNDSQWLLLRARVLMRTQRYSSVIDLLASSDDIAALPLSLLASIREDPDRTPAIMKQVRSEMSDERISIEELWAYQYVIYQANLQQNNIPAASIELETLLSYGEVYSIMGEEYRVDGDELWDLYITLGDSLANKHQLLKGDYAGWFELAKRLKNNSLVSSRGVYAVIALNASKLEDKHVSHKHLVDLLVGRKNYLELFNQLYVKSSRVEDLDQLSEEVRYRLVGMALKKRKIELAGQLMKSLDEPPEGEDEFSWKMRKARVMVLRGDYETGMDVLQASLKNLDEMPIERIDHYLQVVFDLQSVQRHEQALALFDLLKPEWLGDTHRREIAFWRGESYFELGDFARAAMMFIRSAKETDPTMSDNWAKSARFKAAGALVKARLYDDAETMYKSLLLITVNAARKAVIKQEIQHIQLMRNASEKDSESTSIRTL